MNHRTESPAKSSSLQFLADDPRKPSGRALSRCENYLVTWTDVPRGRWWNAWFGDAPRKHLIGTFEKDAAKAACDVHHAKYFQPVQKTYSQQPEQATP